MRRRDLLMSAVAVPAAAHRIWVDPRLEALPQRPWRKIHLDFHNSQFVPKIGDQFDAATFGATLEAANVDAIVVFAKDMHGYFYYPSAFGPVHRGLKFDLLGAQVEECRKRKIAVYAYYCTTWDNYLADQHRDWLVIKRDGSNYLPKPGETPGWTALCLAYEPFVRLMLDHTREFVSRYALDGAWFDMPVPVAGECFCPECLRQIRAKGLDPEDKKVQREHKQALHIAFIERVQKTVEAARPGCQVDFNGQGVYGLGARVRYMDNIDIEALPTAQWGYYYFPAIVRYARTFGVTTYGMTGRFKASWGDFGGLKLSAQLDTELAGIVSHGARCDIGDQMPPDGRLDAAVYHVIGKSYARIKAIEPYLEGAVPVVEAALVTAGHPLDHPSSEANYGLVKLLTESRVQFDVVEPDVDLARYALLVLADTLEVPPRLAERLRAFIGQGGAVISNYQAGWLESHGLEYAGDSGFKPAYMVPKAGFTAGIPPYPYALYDGAARWRAKGPARVIAALGEPLFQRSGEHYTSHRQTPFDHETEFAAIAISGRAGLFAFPLGLSYYNQGYWVYRKAFQHVLKTLLPNPIVETNAPASAELTVTRQKGRYLVHIVNFSALRRTPKHPDFYEEPVPLTNINIRLNLPVQRPERTIPRIEIHEIVPFDMT